MNVHITQHRGSQQQMLIYHQGNEYFDKCTIYFLSDVCVVVFPVPEYISSGNISVYYTKGENDNSKSASVTGIATTIPKRKMDSHIVIYQHPVIIMD